MKKLSVWLVAMLLAFPVVSDAAAKKKAKRKPATVSSRKKAKKPVRTRTARKVKAKPTPVPAADSPEDLEAPLPEELSTTAPSATPSLQSANGAAATSGFDSGLAASAEPPSRALTSNSYALELRAGPRVFQRSLSFNQDLFKRLYDYRVQGAVALGLNVDAYPLAHLTRGFPGQLGISAAYQRAAGLSSRDLSGQTIPTEADAFDVAVNARLPLGARSHVAPGLGFGAQRFELKAPDASRTALPPNVSYSFFRFGAQGLFGLGESFDLLLHGHYLFVRDAGMITSSAWFPRASVGGVDLGAGVQYRFTERLGANLTASVRRYFYKMNPVPGDPVVAGGAIDQYPSAFLSMSYRM